jgi:hypothetical protein
MTEELKNAFDCYGAIAKWLIEEAPEPWENIVVEFEIIEIDDVSNERIEYVPKKDPQSRKQFFIDDTGFAECFFQLARLTSTPEKGLFRKCKFTLLADGRYKSDFEY